MTGPRRTQIGATLPDLSGPFVVSPTAIDEVATDGRTVLRELATPDGMAAYRGAIEAAAHLLGVDGVRLSHDQALFKEPGGGRTPWHQDQCYWPLDTDKTITMWMPLVDVPGEVGTRRDVPLRVDPARRASEPH